MSPTFFISYRRDDASAEASRISRSVRDAFGEDQVFMDISGIEAGDRWPDELAIALREAQILIAVIGPNWLRLGDEYGIRRIDQPDDWVKAEIESFLSSGKWIVPVCVSGAPQFPGSALPAAIRDLASLQHLEIRRDYWDHDIKLLTSVLESHRKTTQVTYVSTSDSPYPKPPPEVPDPLSTEKIAEALNGSLSRWSWVASRAPGLPSGTREELSRAFVFKTFRDAVNFMAEVAPGCDIWMHHPRWENIFRTVFVNLSTWDIGSRISDRDIKLARYFDQAYTDYTLRQ